MFIPPRSQNPLCPNHANPASDFHIRNGVFKSKSRPRRIPRFNPSYAWGCAASASEPRCSGVRRTAATCARCAGSHTKCSPGLRERVAHRGPITSEGS